MSAPERRTIGRILSLGFPLPGVRADNYTFVSAPAFFDYDAVVVDPSQLSRLIDGTLDGSVEAQTYSGLPVRNAEPAAGFASLGEVLLRRRDETAALLARGGLVACFAHPSVTHTGICGTDKLDMYYWLGELTPHLVAAEGTQVEVLDYAHPMAAFVERQLANLSYRAYVDTARVSGARVFAASHGGAPVGVEVPSPQGRIVFLPALKAVPSGDARYNMSDALQSSIRQMLGVMAEGRDPQWLSGFGLPGLDERAAAVTAARDAFDAARKALDTAEHAHHEIAKYQRLLWQEGEVGLDEIVFDALRLIGCDVYAQEPDAPELRIDGTAVLVEIDAREDAIALAPHFRLRQRIDRAIETRGQAPRGLLLINGYRLSSPAERRRQASDALVAAAEAAHYCVATTASLFEAVRAHLAGDDAAVVAYRCALLETEGLLA